MCLEIQGKVGERPVVVEVTWPQMWNARREIEKKVVRDVNIVPIEGKTKQICA